MSRCCHTSLTCRMSCVKSHVVCAWPHKICFSPGLALVCLTWPWSCVSHDLDPMCLTWPWTCLNHMTLNLCVSYDLVCFAWPQTCMTLNLCVSPDLDLIRLTWPSTCVTHTTLNFCVSDDLELLGVTWPCVLHNLDLVSMWPWTHMVWGILLWDTCICVTVFTYNQITRILIGMEMECCFFILI